MLIKKMIHTTNPSVKGKLGLKIAIQLTIYKNNISFRTELKIIHIIHHNYNSKN